MHACKYLYFKRVLGNVVNNIDPSGGGKSLPNHENIREKDLVQSIFEESNTPLSSCIL